MAPTNPASSRVAMLVSLIVLVAACEAKTVPSSDTVTAAAKLMTPADLQALKRNPPDQRVVYGPDSSQYGELRVPPGNGPHPVVVLIHGGCWKAAYAQAAELGPIGDALKEKGIATWNIEYRRLGQPGGGWPGTFLDVGRGIDHLRTLAPQYKLDLGRVIVVGHSAGGHLAMWAAARHRLTRGSEIHVANPLPVRGVVDLAGRLDMRSYIGEYEKLCGDSVVRSLLGGTPTTVPERYVQSSAMTLLPLGVPQVIVLGIHEDFVPKPLADAYVQAAERAGDSARVVVIQDAGHFEIASPSSAAWPQVESAILSLLGGKPLADSAAKPAKQ